MAVSEDFNDSAYKARLVNKFVLELGYRDGASYYLMHFDFMAREMTLRTERDTAVRKFSAVDEELLTTAVEGIKALGGDARPKMRDIDKMFDDAITEAEKPVELKPVGPPRQYTGLRRI